MNLLKVTCAWFLSLLTLGACGNSSQNPAPLPIQGTPTISIVTPKENDTFPLDGTVEVQLAVEDFIPENGSVYLIVDERPPVHIPFPSLHYQVRDLVEGSHILRAYLVDHTNKTLQNPEAFTFVNYHVGTNNNLWHIDANEPVLTIHHPSQIITTESVYFDILLHNFSFEEGYIGIQLWNVASPSDRQTIKITSHTPQHIPLPKGTYNFSAELYTNDGTALTSNWSWQNGTFRIQ